MSEPKPYVAVATFCEKSLQERDGVHSIIRVIDTVTVVLPQGVTASRDVTVKPVVSYPLFIMLRAGDVRGKRTVSVRLRTPSNEIKNVIDPLPVVFTGDEQAAVIRIDATFSVEEYGLFWAEVLVENDVLVRVPLRLRAKQESEPPSP